MILYVTSLRSFVCITMDNKNYSSIISNLLEFKKISSINYANLITEKLWIISDENLQSIFKRIENKTGYPIPENVKEFYMIEYQQHRENLKKALNLEENIRKR